MKYLIIGNGFDIAHNLPTKYSDFINFVYNEEFYNNDNLKLLYNKENINSLKKENKILKYINESSKSNWIDVENKLLEIIICIFDWHKYLKIQYRNKVDASLCNTEITYLIFEENYFYDESLYNKSKLKKILYKLLFDDFRGIDRQRIDEKSIEDIYRLQDDIINDFYHFIDIFAKYIAIIDTLFVEKIPFFKNNEYDAILSFNYTSTYSRLYNPDTPIHFIHGNVKKNNIVLGVGSDYYDSSYSEKSLHFYKFYQRLIKNTDTNFQRYFTERQSTKIILDIFGHSLDPTDEDILKLCINNSNKINIYYINEQDRYDKIVNLIKILGKNQFIEYTVGNDKKIFFIQSKKV